MLGHHAVRAIGRKASFWWKFGSDIPPKSVASADGLQPPRWMQGSERIWQSKSETESFLTRNSRPKKSGLIQSFQTTRTNISSRSISGSWFRGYIWWSWDMIRPYPDMMQIDDQTHTRIFMLLYLVANIHCPCAGSSAISDSRWWSWGGRVRGIDRQVVFLPWCKLLFLIIFELVKVQGKEKERN